MATTIVELPALTQGSSVMRERSDSTTKAVEVLHDNSSNSSSADGKENRSAASDPFDRLLSTNNESITVPVTFPGQDDDDDDDDEGLLNFSKSDGKRKKRMTAVLSDDESNDRPDNNDEGNCDDEKSDDEDEEEEIAQRKRRVIRTVDSDDEGKDDDGKQGEVTSINNEPTKKFTYRSDVFTADDSSDDESRGPYLPPTTWRTEEEEEEQRLLSIAKRVVGKPKNTASQINQDMKNDDESANSIKKAKKKSLTAARAEREQELTEIHSETQRLAREAPVSLPYHRPKQRTLRDFLNRKTRNILPVATGTTKVKCSLKSKAVLESLARQLEERKLEMKEFYKSESESDNEDPEDKEWTPAMENEGEDKDDPTEENKEEAEKEAGEKCTNEEESISIEMISNKVVDEDKENAKDDVGVDNGACESGDVKLCFEEEDEEEETSSLDQIGVNMEETVAPSVENENYVCAEPCNATELKQVGDVEESDDDSNGVLMEEEDCDEGEDYDDFAPELNEDKNEGSRKFKSLKMTAQDLADEDMADLVLLDEDSNIDAPTLTETLLPQSPLDTQIVPASSTVTPLHPKLSKLVSKLGAAVATNVKFDSPIGPKLTPGSAGVIDLDDDFTTPKAVNPGLVDLINRFAKHSAADKKNAKKSEHIKLNVVSKEKNAQGNDELVSSEVTFSIEGDHEDEFTKCQTPGGKLQILKNNLRAKIAKQRAESTRRRQEQKNFMETEEITTAEDPFDLPNEEEEEELTDESSEGESEPELEDDVDMTDKKRESNVFMDDEAEESAEEANEEGYDGNDVSSDDNDGDDDEEVIEPVRSKSYKKKKHLVLSDSDDDELPDTQPVAQQKTTTVQSKQMYPPLEESNSCFDLSVIPAHQPQNSIRNNNNNKVKATDTHSSSLSLEDALWCPLDTDTTSNMFFPPGSTTTASYCRGNSQLPYVSEEEEQEVRLDFSGVTEEAAPVAEGNKSDEDELAMLCTGGFSEGPSKAPDEDDAALMALCSGRFTSCAPPPPRAAPLLDETVVLPRTHPLTQIGVTQDDQLLALCSGTFKTQAGNKDGSLCPTNSQMKLTSFFNKSNTDTMNKSSATGESVEVTDKPSSSPSVEADVNPPPAVDDEGVEDSSDGEGLPEVHCYNEDAQDGGKKRKRILFMDDDEEEEKEGDGNNVDNCDDSSAEERESEDEEESRVEKFKGFVDKTKRKIRAEFLDKEAELSGSEAEVSDDEEDREEDDVMEEELGDQEYYDEDELRDEVGHTHWKGELAKDQREVRLLQELYLEDGDLHGEGRTRSFRWKNLDKDVGTDDRPAEESDKEEEDDEEAAKWRQQRFEREQFLLEQENKRVVEQPDTTDCGPGPGNKKAAAVVVRSSSLRIAQDSSVTAQKVPLQLANPEVEGAIVKNPLLAKQQSLPGKQGKCGSFLSRGASKLARLASFIKERNDGSQSVTAKVNAAGNFVFHSLTEEEVAARREGVKRSAPAEGTPANVKKKPRLVNTAELPKRSTSLNYSIFKHL